jgi:pyruvate,water dikinase
VTAGLLERAVDADLLRAHALAGAHAEAQAVVRSADPPRAAVTEAHERLTRGRVAVRSSATAEDSDAACFAGQQETYLNVEGADAICGRIVDCWASFFSERALFYRGHKGSLEDLGMAVVVQRMVDADRAGVLFTVDPVQRRRDQMLIEGVRGLGEQVVSGEVTPDHYVTDRAGSVKRSSLPNGGVLNEAELRGLAELGLRLEEHFGGPQDVEWAIADGRAYLLQSRPVTTL